MVVRDSAIEDLYLAFQRGIIDRRHFIRRLVALGVSASVMAELVPGLDVAEAAHGVPGPAWQGGKPGGTLRVSYSDPIGGMTNLDSSNGGPPFAAYWSVNQLFYRGLMFFGSGPTLTPLPDMAEDFPKISPDGLVYTYKLRKGIRFHHGRECTAEDFVWTWDRALIPSTGGWVAGYVGPIKGANNVVNGKTTHVSGFKALDRYTIQVTLTQPDAVLNSILALPPFYPMPREMVAKLGKNWRTHVIGTGPFKLQQVDTVNNQVIAVKNPHYYYPQLPYLNQIVIQMNVPDTLAFEKLTRGDLDMIGYGIPTGVYGQVVTNPKYKGMWENAPNLSTNYLAMNVKKAPFDNVKVRQAMNYAINKQRIARLQVATVNPGKTIYPPGMLGYDPTLKGYDYNPDKARQLLKEAGYPNGFSVEYAVITPPIDGVLKAPLIVSDLAAVGITARIRQYPSDTFNTLAAKASFMLYDWNYTVGVPDPSDIIGGQFTSNAAYNYVHFSDAEVDRLAAQGLAELNTAKRVAIYRQIERRLVDLAPMVFVSYLKTTTFHGKNVHNLLMNGITGAQFDRMWLS
ncbi:MAG TPA: ABC transporter substrate-binding protein [Chloroflexota bacterium]|nr:ABC transporter substrate-binding protein [Chloroflexota bacterium]